MKRKALLICVTGAILQMGFFTGCSDDKSEDKPASSQKMSVETSLADMPDSDAVTNTDGGIILPEIEIEDDISETSQQVSVQPDKSNNDDKAVTTKSENIRNETVTTKVTAKITTPAVTEKSNTPAKETTTKPADSDVSAGTVTTETINDAIELPEIEFD